MRNLYSVIIVILALTIFRFQNLYSQNTGGKTPENALKEARSLYREGLPENIPNLLNPYLEDGFNRIDKKEAYKLIILSYLFNDYKIEANKVLYDFMKIYPEFKPSENDTNDLKYLYQYKSFKTNIVFSIGPVVGVNMASPVIEKSFLITGNAGEKTVASSSSLVYGIQLGTRIIDYLDIRVDALMSESKYSFKQLNTSDDYTEVTESIKQFYIPLWLVPYYPIKDHRVYLKLGWAACLNQSASDDFTLATDAATYDISDKRLNFTGSLGFGGGFSLKIPRGFISLEGTYMLGSNIVDNANRNVIPEIESRFQYMDDDFKINNLMVSLNYVYLFYKSKELKKK